jgi:hypothetical protein
MVLCCKNRLLAVFWLPDTIGATRWDRKLTHLRSFIIPVIGINIKAETVPEFLLFEMLDTLLYELGHKWTLGGFAHRARIFDFVLHTAKTVGEFFKKHNMHYNGQ